MIPAPWKFWVGFSSAILLIAGAVSYLASSSPDGLDSATMRGCAVTETTDHQHLIGDCIAQHATEHEMANSPLADYAIGGWPATGGLAGIIGVVATVALAGSLFWLISRARR